MRVSLGFSTTDRTCRDSRLDACCSARTATRDTQPHPGNRGGTPIRTTGLGRSSSWMSSRNSSRNRSGVGYYCVELCDGVNNYTVMFLTRGYFRKPKKSKPVIRKPPVAPGRRLFLQCLPDLDYSSWDQRLWWRLGDPLLRPPSLVGHGAVYLPRPARTCGALVAGRGRRGSSCRAWTSTSRTS